MCIHINRDDIVDAKALLKMQTMGKEEFHRMNEGYDNAKRHDFSLRFKWKMRRLIKAYKREERARLRHSRLYHDPCYILFNRWWKKTVFIVGGLCILLYTAASQVEAGRIPVLNVLADFYEGCIGIRVDLSNGPQVDGGTISENLYEPGWIPKGYRVIDRQLENSFYVLVYKGKNNKQIRFLQSFINVYSKIDSERSQYQKMNINNVVYYFVKTDDYKSLIWFDGKYQYKLEGKENIKILLRIAEDLQDRKI